jgi:uncharacterized SAM-binding protein YcdF (DUF218 family)
MELFVWRQILKNLILPPTGPMLLAIAGLALTVITRTRRTGIVLCAIGLATLWALATPVIADHLVRAAEPYPALDLRRPVAAQAVVILAGGVRVDAPEYGSPAPNATTLERVTYGARVARATGLPVLVSGGRYEAQAMQEFLQRDFGITPRWVESHSHDTRENALLSAAILARDGVQKVVLVTSAAHMARARLEFSDAGIASVPAPAALWTRREYGPLGFVPNPDALKNSQRALYEALGLLEHRVRVMLVPPPAVRDAVVPQPPPASPQGPPSAHSPPRAAPAA